MDNVSLSAAASDSDYRSPFLPRAWSAIGAIAGPLIGLILVLTIFGIWKPEQFLSKLSFLNVFRNNYHFAVAAVGMTFVIITAGIDLSVGSTMALAGVCCAYTLVGFTLPTFDSSQGFALGGIAGLVAALCSAGNRLRRGDSRAKSIAVAALWGIGVTLIVFAIWRLLAGRSLGPQSAIIAILVGVCAGALVGLLNGALIASLALPPFIVTLATLEAVRGVSLYISDAVPINLPMETKGFNFGRLHYPLHKIETSSFAASLPVNVWLTLIVVLLVAPVLHFTVLGRYSYAIGSNERTARLCGVPVERFKTLCYVICGACAGLAGVMMVSKFHGGPPDEFRGAELTIIAAVVIGGTSLFGGEGTVIGSVLGVLMLGFLGSGCNIAGITPHIQRVFIGGTIVLAAAADRFRHLGR